MQKYMELDLNQFLKKLWKKSWLIILVTVLCGEMAFLATRYLVVPLYTAGIKMYVNNTTEIDKDISSSDLTASQSLVETYIAIIRSDVVLDGVAELTGLPYSAETINGMISAGAINSTEVFMVSVSNSDPEAAAAMANAIAEIASVKIGEIVSGSSVKIVDYAKIPVAASSPSYFENTLVGALIGLVLSIVLLVLREVLDKRIKTEDDLERISALPILGAVSEFAATEKEDRVYGYCYGMAQAEKAKKL